MPSMRQGQAGMLHNDGYVLIESILDGDTIAALIESLAISEMTRLSRGQSVFGGRNLLDSPDIRALASSPALRTLVEPVVGPSAKPVRALFFHKTAEANWPVLWHQDLSLAVADHHEIEGWGPWTLKGGVPHVQPPRAILDEMLTVRIHLDDCGPHNGPLRVLPGTQKIGRLDRKRMTELRRSTPEVTCTGPSGSVLLMRPLLLHASAPAKVPTHRRVIHIEFAPADLLPPPLTWAH
jgi:ectoine hydroxylase-related dioxygenase (phytanoyl-CoA dioxygenase family)